MNTSEYSWIPKVEVRSGRGTVYGPVGMSSGPSSQRSRALCLTLGAAVLVAATLFAAERQPKDAGSRAKETGTVRSEAGRLVTGDPAQINAVIAAAPPTLILAVNPVDPPNGIAYPDGCAIIGNELRCDRTDGSKGGFRAFFHVQVSGWGVEMATYQVQIDCAGYFQSDCLDVKPNNQCNGGINNGLPCLLDIDCPGGACGLDLKPAIQTCGTDADCKADNATGFGESWVKCVGGFCQNGYIDRNGLGAPSPEAESWCEPNDGGCAAGGVATGTCNYKYFSVSDSVTPDGRTDNGELYYGGTLVLDIPAGAKGKYTVNLNSNTTFGSAPGNPPIDFESLAETGFVVNFVTGSCCHNLGTPLAGCFDQCINRSDCETAANAPFVFTPGALCDNKPTSDGCAAACCLPGGTCDDRPPADCFAAGGLLTTACLGDGDGSGRDDACEGFIPAGFDCWKTVCGRTQVSFLEDNPIPSDFFAPGSEPFAGQILLGGASGPGDADTRVQRLEAMVLDDLGDLGSTPAQLESRNLVSCDPIEVMTAGVPVLWNVQVGLSTVPAPIRNMTVTKTHPNGGTFTAKFSVQPRFTFTRVDSPSDVRIFDTVAKGIPAIQLVTVGTGQWVHVLDPSAGTVTVCGENFVPGVTEIITGAAASGVQLRRQCCVIECFVNPAGIIVCPGPPDCTRCPSGACCTDAMPCEVVQPVGTNPALQVCLNRGGEYQGDGTNCDDTDGDGIEDVRETNDACANPDLCNTGTNPTLADTDGDGCMDGVDPAPCNRCGRLGECPGFADCDGNQTTDACELEGNDCNGNGTLDRCEAALTGACCSPQCGCAELTWSACDERVRCCGWVWRGFCTRCPTEGLPPNIHDGTVIVHGPCRPNECPTTGVVAASNTADDCAGRQCLYDAWATDPAVSMCHQFGGAGPVIPPDFFGPGSDPFVGQVCLEGVALGPTPYGHYGEADTIICRTPPDPFDRCALPSAGEQTVGIQIVALSLRGKQGEECITVTYNGGSPEQWCLTLVDLSKVPSPVGSLTAVKTHCNGGIYNSVLPVRPRFTFTKQADPGQQRVLDTGNIGGWAAVTLIQNNNPTWTHDRSPDLLLATDHCTNFHPGIEDTNPLYDCDCNENAVRDECDLESGSADCNANVVPDSCEVPAPGGLCTVNCVADCNGNGVPDECEPDCNGNEVADACDIRDGASEDCQLRNGNGNGIPDECEPDCNGNGRPDACDLALGPSFDCDRNGRPDECDVVSGASLDCNASGAPDACELENNDGDGNGVPDECDATRPKGEPPDKNRSIAFSMPPLATATAGPGWPTALRLTLMDLQNPIPPNLPQYPPPDFSAYEFGSTCTDPGGCVRWVGKPGTYLESQDSLGGPTYRAARLQCTPYYHDWDSEGLIYLVGAEVVPSSRYELQNFAAVCMGNEGTCAAVSFPLTISTARSGDVEEPFNPPATSDQPDVTDIAQLVNKFKNVAGAPVKAIAQLQPNLPELNADINALDIVAVVDAVKQLAYAFGGPCPCPSTVPCGITACSSPTPCVAAFGAGATCVKTCIDGANAGDPCIDNTHGHCPGGTCGNPGNPANPGFCRDRCGRCTP